MAINANKKIRKQKGTNHRNITNTKKIDPQCLQL
jgi:hypothetical protein